jgi:hypothetical protein
MSQHAVEITDEGGFEAPAVFAREWMSFALPRMERLLGVRLDDSGFRVVLSATETHGRRFPVADEEAASLRGPFDEGEGPSPDGLVSNQTHFYAHGVATRARPRLALGPDVPDGTAVICLDVPTLTSLAGDLNVSIEGMLARVLAHELSHVLRGHIDDEEVTHGYVREGDAQRDAWQLMTDALASDRSRLAAAGRTAQVLLAEKQPGAYQKFGLSSPETGRWSPTSASASVWVLSPMRETRVLAQREVIETPVMPSILGNPQIGDHVVLVSEDLAAGEWIIVGIGDASEGRSAADAGALEAMARAGDRSAKSPRWLHLRKQEQMIAAAPAPSGLYNFQLSGKVIGTDSHRELWEQSEKVSLEDALASIATARRAAFVMSIDRMRRDVEAMGGTVPDIDTDAWNPFQD